MTNPQPTLYSVMKKLKVFPLRSAIGQGCPLLNIVLEVLVTVIREDKKRIRIGKEVRPQNDQIASKNLVNLPDIKLIHRNTLLCTNSERSEREIKETIPFTITSKRIKYLGKTYLRRQKTCTLKTMRH